MTGATVEMRLASRLGASCGERVAPGRREGAVEAGIAHGS
jgi:hypothetical protein